MKFAIHYSPQIVELLNARLVEVDLFKLPAWQELIPEAQQIRPVYIHFDLQAGSGLDDNSIDWQKIETLLEQTTTPYINVHINATMQDYPLIPLDSEDAAHRQQLLENTIRDVERITRRFGSERVILENDHDNGKVHLRAMFQADFIREVVETTGCGFLFDIAHARLAARYLEIEFGDYCAALPVKAIREIHVSGVQPFDAYWVNKLEQANISSNEVKQFAGRVMDHLPMTDTDWTLLEQVCSHMNADNRAKPWVMACEYSGVGPLWQAVTDKAVLAAEVPRLYALAHASS